MRNDYNGKKRSELPDNVFGIPQERKYPMPDEKHTRSAIKLFNHVEPKYEEQLAKAVIKNMRKYNIDGSVVGPNNRLRKYLPKDMIKEYVEEACKDLTHARKLCNAVRKLARKYNANYFFVTDGASSYSNGNGKYNTAAKEMRDHMDDWERNNGFNPDDDWTNDINNVSNYRLLKESSVLEGLLKSDFSYTGIKTSTEKSEFKRNFREVFKEDPTESSINNMQMIKYKESLVGYIGFSRYTIDKKKYLGIGNFMIIKKYQHRGIGSKVISDIIDKYKDKYDEIYCYVDENNTNAISFYKKIAKVDTENLTRYGYYVSLYRKNKSSIKEETRIEDNKLPKHIYHISYINHDGETFEPRTYDNDNVKNGMERKVKRVCFSDSITRALYSIFPNGAYDADFYVHVPNSDCKVYKTTSDDIYDADITHELWIKEPVQMKCIGKIHVNGVSDKTHTIDVDKDKAGYGKKKYHETRWNWVEKYEKDETLYESYISEDDDMNKIAKEIVKTIKPIVLTSKNKQQASRIGLTLKCEVESLDHNTICILILDGSQDARDSKEARLLLSNIQNDCKSKLVGYVSKITIGDGDEGCLYFTPNKKYIEKNRKDLIQESSILPQDTGISTVIFDIGDVLVSANIKDYLMADPEVPNEIVDELLKLWFVNKDEVDDTMDLDTYREIINKRMGVEFSKYIPKLFRYNVECVTAFDYTIPMIQDLKDKGYKVYYLSNWSAWTHDLLQEAGKFDFLKLMDGGVFSYDVGYMKPNEEIYKILLNKYKINPEEAIFFDDREENIEAANKMGINGILFDKHDPSIVYNALEKFSVLYEQAEEGCLYFTMDKGKIKKNRKDLIKESTNEEIAKSEINDIKEIISILNDDDFKNFKFTNIAYCDIRYRNSKPIAFITIRTKPVNNYIVGFISLAVIPKYQNQGIGRSLTEKAIKWFKKNKGIDFLEWWCLPDNEASNKLANAAGFKEYIARDQSEYIQYTMESSISEYGTTAGAMVGSNQPDSVYIVNYMQNNAFSGHKEPKFGICKKGMKDLHIVGGKYNRFHYVSDVTKFKEEASDIHVYRYKGKPKNEFYDIIEDMDDDDLNIYKMVTGREIEDRSMIQFDGDFIEEDCFFDEIDAIKAITEAGLSEVAENLHAIPILTEMVQGRPYNYYRDINGVFVQNEITNIRSKSYESIDEIPKAELDIVKKGYLV